MTFNDLIHLKSVYDEQNHHDPNLVNVFQRIEVQGGCGFLFLMISSFLGFRRQGPGKRWCRLCPNIPNPLLSLSLVGNLTFFKCLKGRSLQHTGSMLRLQQPKTLAHLWQGRRKGSTSDNEEVEINGEPSVGILERSFDGQTAISVIIKDNVRSQSLKMTRSCALFPSNGTVIRTNWVLQYAHLNKSFPFIVSFLDLIAALGTIV